MKSPSNNLFELDIQNLENNIVYTKDNSSNIIIKTSKTSNKDI